MTAVTVAKARPSCCSTMRPGAAASMPNASFKAHAERFLQGFGGQFLQVDAMRAMTG